MSASNLDNQPTLLSGMSQDDINTIRSVEEQLMKKITLSANDDSKSKKTQEFKQKVKEVKEDDFNISKIKDESSGRDLGARKKLEKKIAEGKSLGLDVSALVRKLEEMIADIEREKALNADSKEVEKISPINNSVSSEMDHPRNLAELKKEAFELFDSLLSRGIIEIFNMASGVINSDDGVNNVEVNRDKVYIVSKTASIEELGEVESLVKINKKIHEMSPQDDLMEHFAEKFENGNVAQVYSYLALKDTDDETDLRKLSPKERFEMRQLFEKNPDNFKICTHAVGGDEQTVTSLIKESEAVLSKKFFEFKSSQRDPEAADMFGIPVKENANDVPSPSISLATAINLVESITQIGITFAQNANNVQFSSIASNAINLVEGIAMQINENSNDQSFVERMKKQNESGNKNNARQL